MKTIFRRYVGMLLLALLAAAGQANAAAYSNYFSNKLIDQLFRAQAYTFPSSLYVGLLTSTKGARANSTAYVTNDTYTVTAGDGKTHLYKITANCTSASSAPSFPGAANEAITDGTCTATEQTSGLKAATAAVEASYTGYARAAITSSLANWAGTQAAGSTIASSGTTATTSNNGTVTIGSAASSGPTYVWAFAIYDASSSGNMLIFVPLTTVRTIASGDGAPSFAAGAAQIYVDQ